jgi:hypothetical protein
VSRLRAYVCMCRATDHESGQKQSNRLIRGGYVCKSSSEQRQSDRANIYKANVRRDGSKMDRSNGKVKVTESAEN